jgi:hypothetical protein
MFGESTGPVDNVPSDAPLGGNRKCTEQGVPEESWVQDRGVSEACLFIP